MDTGMDLIPFVLLLNNTHIMINLPQWDMLIQKLNEGLTVSDACKATNISRSQFYKHRQSNYEFYHQATEAVSLARSAITDIAESNIIARIKAGSIPESKWWWKNMLRYGQYHDQTPASYIMDDYLSVNRAPITTPPLEKYTQEVLTTPASESRPHTLELNVSETVPTTDTACIGEPQPTAQKLEQIRRREEFIKAARRG